MVQWNLKGYVAGSILIQADRGEGCRIEMTESCVCGGRVQIKLGAVSRHLVRGHGLVTMDDCEECWRVYCECGAGALLTTRQPSKMTAIFPGRGT
jgi:hypothetical protein